jgi:hypothetical protein
VSASYKIYLSNLYKEKKMKKLLVLMMTLTSAHLFASHTVDVQKAEYLNESNELSLDVVYGGGCKEHKFELKLVVSPLEIYPTMVDATLIDHTDDDRCRALVHKTVKFKRSDLGLGNKAYRILFDSDTTLNLPEIGDEPVSLYNVRATSTDKKLVQIHFSTKEIKSSMCHIPLGSYTVKGTRVYNRLTKKYDYSGEISLQTTQRDFTSPCLMAFGPHSGSVTLAKGQLLGAGTYKVIIDGTLQATVNVD